MDAKPENKCPDCEKAQGMAKYWEMEYKRLMEQLVEQKKVVEQSASLNEQAAAAIKALNNKIVRIANENQRLLNALKQASNIRGSASAKLIAA